MQLEINDILKLEQSFGSPLYIFDEEAFVENYENFDNCFKSIYDNYKISYSYKTNYAPYICRIVKEHGGYAEVVSDMELQIAKSIGYENRHIVYNGPSKGPLAIEHILGGGILNIDNFEELERVCSVAEESDKLLKIGFRVNIDIGQNFISRFGIDETDLDKAFDLVSRQKNLKVVGIHCHIGRSRTIEAWQNRVAKMMRIADRFFDETPEYISLGSGMFGKMDEELGSQFAKDRPTFEDYAKAVCVPFAERFSGEDKPILFTEPGTTLINKYISFAAKVESIKTIKGKTFVVLNSSKHNLGEICELKKLPIKIISGTNEKKLLTDADFVGYTCLEHDVLYHGFSGELAVGDYIVFDNIGGYSNVSKPPFIRPNCAMVSDNGNLIKKAETVWEVIGTYE